MRKLIPIIIIAICIAALHVFPYANAITITTPTNTTAYLSQSNLIGIQLSQSCIVLEKNHMKTNCPTYAKLKQFDNTNPQWSGQWVNDTWYHRTTSHVKNLWQFYEGKTVIMVDPPADFTTRAKMIIVQPDNFTWINPDESVGANHTRNEYMNKSVVGCYEAHVAPVQKIINQTISYLKGNCQDTTYYNDKKIVKTNNTPFTFKNPYSSLNFKTYLQSMMNGHYTNSNHTAGGIGPANCITHKCSFIDPYKKIGW